MVQFDDVSKVYVPRAGGAATRALTGVTFRVAAGELVVLSGATGAGKSTVLRLISGEERPTAGRLLVDGEEVGALGRRGVARLRRRLGILPAAPRVLADATVGGNLTLVLRALGASRRDARARARELLRDAGLEGRAGAFPRELTTLEIRQLCLARALSGSPRVLLADEPTAGLEPVAAAAVVARLGAARARGTTVVVATSAPGIAADVGARVLVLEGGRLIAGP